MLNSQASPRHFNDTTMYKGLYGGSMNVAAEGPNAALRKILLFAS